MTLRQVDYWLPRGKRKPFRPGDCVRVVNGGFFSLGGVMHIDAIKMAGQRVFLDLSVWEGTAVTGRKYTILVEGRSYRRSGITVRVYPIRRATPADHAARKLQESVS